MSATDDEYREIRQAYDVALVRLDAAWLSRHTSPDAFREALAEFNRLTGLLNALGGSG